MEQYQMMSIIEEEKKQRVIKELEETKAEIDSKVECLILGERNIKKEVLEIIDNHIKELNNENII